MTPMKRLPWISATAAAFLLSGSLAAAQETEADVEAGGDLDVTMTLLPEGATQPDPVTRTIALPDEAAETEAAESSAEGLATANEARQRREAGLETAAEARERGQELGAEMAEQMRARPDDLPERPSQPAGAGQ
jgi:hypothetical protein